MSKMYFKADTRTHNVYVGRYAVTVCVMMFFLVSMLKEYYDARCLWCGLVGLLGWCCLFVFLLYLCGLGLKLKCLRRCNVRRIKK